MTRVLLVRHALCDAVGTTLAGHAPGVSLNHDGRREAVALARRLSRESVTAVISSPLERAVETAEIVAALHELHVTTSAAFIDLDFGDWTGRTLASLEGDPLWRSFNEQRTTTAPPGGELLTTALDRAVLELDALLARMAAGTLVVVTHADIIRALVCHFTGMPLDNLLRLRIDTASVTEFLFHGDWPELVRLNAT